MSDRCWVLRLRGQMCIAVVLFAGMLLVALPQPTLAPEPAAPPIDTLPASASTLASRLTRPLAFEETRGQSDPAVRFLARVRGVTFFLTDSEAAFAYSAEMTLRFAFAGANPQPTVTAEQSTGATVSYFIGNDPSQWHPGIQTNAKIRYTGLYPGIDLVYYGDPSGQLEYDAIVAPGADPSRFAFAITGADVVRIAPEGDLLLQTAAGEVRQHAPIITQEINGTRCSVAGGFDLRADGTVGFRIGTYEPSVPLTIDPTVVFATYDGGTGYDQGNAVAADATGNFFFDGFTTGPTFFNAVGGYHAPTTGGKDVFITKFGPTGTHLADAIVGGTADDVANDLIFDSVRSLLYVVGETPSTGFPTTAGVFKPNCATGGQKEGFVLALDPTLATLVTSTCVGNTSGTTHNTSVKSVTFSGSKSRNSGSDPSSTATPAPLPGMR